MLFAHSLFKERLPAVLFFADLVTSLVAFHPSGTPFLEMESAISLCPVRALAIRY